MPSDAQIERFCRAVLSLVALLDLKWVARHGIPEHEIYMGEDYREMADCHLHVWHPKYLEHGLETLRLLYLEDKYDLIIFDSFGASPVKAAAEGTMEDTVMMKRARVGSTFKEIFSAISQRGNAAVVMVNQVYTNTQQPYFDKLKPEGGFVVSSGGESIPFLSSVRIYMEPPKHISTEKETVTDLGEKLPKGFILGKEHRGMVHKNKTGKNVPQHFAFHLMTYPESYIDYAWDIVEAGEALGVLTRQANTYFFGDEKIASSRARTEQAIADNPDLAFEVETAIIHAIQEENQHAGPQNDVTQPDAEPLHGGTVDQEFQEAVPAVFVGGGQ